MSKTHWNESETHQTISQKIIHSFVLYWLKMGAVRGFRNEGSRGSVFSVMDIRLLIGCWGSQIQLFQRSDARCRLKGRFRLKKVETSKTKRQLDYQRKEEWICFQSSIKWKRLELDLGKISFLDLEMLTFFVRIDLYGYQLMLKVSGLEKKK